MKSSDGAVEERLRVLDRGAYASRVLVVASRDDGLVRIHSSEKKFAQAGRLRQHPGTDALPGFYQREVAGGAAAPVPVPSLAGCGCDCAATWAEPR